MKTIIAGSRDIRDFQHLYDALSEIDWEITEVISGMADGADTMGHIWAGRNEIPIKEFPADWKQLGKSAGPTRNRAMAEYGEALIALWDGKSRGTANMIGEAEKRGLKVYVHLVK